MQQHSNYVSDITISKDVVITNSYGSLYYTIAFDNKCLPYFVNVDCVY